MTTEQKNNAKIFILGAILGGIGASIKTVLLMKYLSQKKS